MNHIKDNHEQEEDRKARWRKENESDLNEIGMLENYIDCLNLEIKEIESGIKKLDEEIDTYRDRIKEIKKQIGWQE